MDVYLLLTPLLLLPLVGLFVFVGCAYLVGLHDYEPPKTDNTPPPPPPAPANLGGPDDLVVSGRYYDAEFRPVVYTPAAHTWKSYPAARVFHASPPDAPDVLVFAPRDVSQLSPNDQPDRGHLVTDPQASPDQPALYLSNLRAFRKLNVVSKSLSVEGNLVHMFPAADAGPFEAIPASGPYFRPNETTLAIFRPTIARWQFKSLDDMNPLNAGDPNPHKIDFGDLGAIPVAGDYLGKGTWRPATYLRASRRLLYMEDDFATSHPPLVLSGSVPDGNNPPVHFDGFEPTDLPVPPLKYDGDFSNDLLFAVYRPGLAALWFFFELVQGQLVAFQRLPEIGKSDDKPAPGPYESALPRPAVFRPNGGTWFAGGPLKRPV
jgi:hypothetical protein